MASRSGIAGLDEELARDLREGAGRNPVYRALAAALPEALSGEARARLDEAWRARAFDAWYDRPRLLLAALRLDAMVTGPAHPLYAALAAEPPEPGAVTPSAVSAALAADRAPLWDAVARRRVQTNETSRAVAWLWPAALAGCNGGARPLALADVGASAGLNLVADALPAIWEDEGGAPVPVVRAPRVVARLGLDVVPVDVRDPAAAAWLRALVWPGERDRAARLDAAIEAFRARSLPGEAPALERSPASAAPARLARLAADHPEALVLALQCVMREYLPADERDAYARGMDAWLLGRPERSAAWIQLEHADEGASAEWPSWIVARWREGARVREGVLARCGYHPRRLRLEGGAAAFAAAFGPGA